MQFYTRQLFLWLICGVICSAVCAQEIVVKTPDGRSVVLLPSGIWRYHDQGKLAEVDASTPAAIVGSYLDVKSWRDRKGMVLDWEVASSHMERRYKDWKPRDFSFKVLDVSDLAPGVPEWRVVTVLFEKNGYSVTEPFYVRKTDAGWRIDWMASIGVGDMTGSEFAATRPREVVTMRVWATLSDVFFSPFQDARDRYWSLDLEDSQGNSFAQGYVSKGTKDGDAIFNSLRGGVRVRMTLDLVCLRGGYSVTCEVRGVRSIGGWWIASPTEKGAKGPLLGLEDLLKAEGLEEALFLIKLEQFDQAIANLSGCIANPVSKIQLQKALYLRGLIRARHKEQLDDAIKDLEAAFVADPDSTLCDRINEAIFVIRLRKEKERK
jgi:hypothetical protein